MAFGDSDGNYVIFFGSLKFCRIDVGNDTGERTFDEIVISADIGGKGKFLFCFLNVQHVSCHDLPPRKDLVGICFGRLALRRPFSSQTLKPSSILLD
jgi:hypothetical protein